MKQVDDSSELLMINDTLKEIAEEMNKIRLLLKEIEYSVR